MKADLVSVVMPARNVSGFVAEAVASVAAQTWPRIELVAVDDGSTDGTGALLDELAASWTGPDRVMKVYRQVNGGAAAARNAALARVRGTYICFLDADDRLDPGLVARLVETLAANPDLVLAAPLWRYIDGAGRPLRVVSDPAGFRHDARDLVVRGPLHSATGVVVRADAARETGPFDTSLSGCIDLDWFVRLVAERGPAAAIVPEPLADYRKRAGQITANWRRMERNWLRVLAKMQAAGCGLAPAEARRARARNLIYWATLAYQAGDYSSSRRLVSESWRLDPKGVISDPLARIRTLAAAASLLPASLHHALRRHLGSDT